MAFMVRNCPKSILNVIYQRYIIFFASERSCRLIVIPEKGVQDFRKRRLQPMQNLSERYFFKNFGLKLGKILTIKRRYDRNV